mmetsp:Transcript_35830/g.90366  ORF Transcript_35830/g.90366 Transcript_35830/m.90366 type:complete len:206 (+) Transcript_35830:472-1089(+)
MRAMSVPGSSALSVTIWPSTKRGSSSSTCRDPPPDPHLSSARWQKSPGRWTVPAAVAASAVAQANYPPPPRGVCRLLVTTHLGNLLRHVGHVHGAAQQNARQRVQLARQPQRTVRQLRVAAVAPRLQVLGQAQRDVDGAREAGLRALPALLPATVQPPASTLIVKRRKAILFCQLTHHSAIPCTGRANRPRRDSVSRVFLCQDLD